jgi:ribosomal protein S18 acetylase RimI-like enzyme
MEWQLRPMPLRETEARFTAEELERQKRSQALLTRLGVTIPASEVDLLTGRVIAWECVDACQVVGHCVGDCLTGEILSLQVASSHEGRGIGRRLLLKVAGCLRTAGADRVWLVAPADPELRAHGFYRALGCRPTGERARSGAEVLVVPDALLSLPAR